MTIANASQRQCWNDISCSPRVNQMTITCTNQRGGKTRFQIRTEVLGTWKNWFNKRKDLPDVKDNHSATMLPVSLFMLLYDFLEQGIKLCTWFNPILHHYIILRIDKSGWKFVTQGKQSVIQVIAPLWSSKRLSKYFCHATDVVEVYLATAAVEYFGPLQPTWSKTKTPLISRIIEAKLLLKVSNTNHAAI